ncbi:unnamed protein product [Schistosoma curassoni]|uniref:DUF6451 domain-containing protein n=1 Tax=Schistosoma curassoni TaxID=6186 RepID=A0A183JLW4_9TREM|nr:unnamed protein product [Schistosoma curassoni]
MKDSVDTQHRDQQAGSRRDLLCTVEIAIPWIIDERTIELNLSSLHNFIDNQEASDSADSKPLCDPLQHYETNADEDKQCCSNLWSNKSQHPQGKRILKYNTASTSQTTIDGDTLEDVETFNIPGSVIDKQGGSDADMKAWIGEASGAFPRLKNTWNSKQLATNVKLRIFSTNVKTVLLYEAETWRTDTTIIKMVQLFINNYLRKILNIR